MTIGCGCSIFTYPIRFLSAEEEIITTYKFGVYDLLVLPPSFPYGGMVSVFMSVITTYKTIRCMAYAGECLFILPNPK